MNTTNKTTRRITATSTGLLLLGLLAQTPALAQDQAPPPPAADAPAAEAAAPATPTPEATPAVTEAPAEAAPPERTLDDRLTTIEGKLEGMDEPFSVLQTDVASMKKLKFSGYIQGRYEKAEDSNFGLDDKGVPRNKTYFRVRRARLKAQYAGAYSEYILQFDAVPDGVTIKDAEASLVLNNENFGGGTTPWELKLTMGQFKVPFGFEVLQSSGDREFPERVRVVRAFFPGERDRGIRLNANYGVFKLSTALINGIGTDDSIYANAAAGAKDQTTWKDLVGRAGVDLEWIVAGVSGYYGHYLWTQKATPASNYRRSRRIRYGADAQLYFDVPEVGGLTVRGELIVQDDKFLKASGVQPDECLDHGKFGWYAAAIQNIGDYVGIGVRYDQYDPTTGVDEGCRTKFIADSVVNLKTPKTDRVDGLTIALLGYVSGNLKATLAWEHLMEQDGAKKDNDITTLQLQAKF